MKKPRKHIFWLFPILLFSVGFVTLFPIQEKAVTATLTTDLKFFTAGKEVECTFLLTVPVATQLHIHSAYGTTVLYADAAKEVTYILPEHFTKKSGRIDYTLFHKDKILYHGIHTIIPNLKTTTHLETYIGPPSIRAGGIDYTMQVEIPTDGFDNPLKEGTEVLIKHQFLGTEREDIVPIKDMIAWKNIYSYQKSGRILHASKVYKATSKEFATEVYANQPVNFKIYSARQHHYADGNQITEFYTDIVKDRYGNKVSDGTWVTFYSTTSKGMILKTGGSTVNGIAKGRLLHPDQSETWNVKAYVTGMAESNDLVLQYKPIIETFPIDFSENCRTITVGPIYSFMEQRIPDGALVRLMIYKGKEYIDTKIKTSFDGKVEFILSKDFYPSGNYILHIKVLGIEKEFKNIEL